jgi:lipopolysaccharide cholinephosphotransferase
MTDDDRQELHRLLMVAFKDFDRICRANGLQYYLIGGTLLGAVRHGGIIPWDDDIDVGMLRPEYERFLRVAPQQLAPQYSVHSVSSDPNHVICFTKIRMADTRFVSSQEGAVSGVFVDVFPLDNAPNSHLLRRLHALVASFFLFIIRIRHGDTSSPLRYRRFLRRIAHAILRFIPRRIFMTGFQRLMQVSGDNDSTSIVNVGGSWGYRRECWKRSYFMEYIEMSFGDAVAYVPAGWHEILTRQYGDYMTPPPEKQRADRHQIRVDSSSADGHRSAG